MSLENSLDDIISLISFTNTLRTRFKDAPSQCKDVSVEVNLLSTVIRNLEYHLPELDLTAIQEKDLTSCIETCKSVLEDLNNVVDKCQDLETPSSDFRLKTRRVWKRATWDFTQVQALRPRISSSANALNALYMTFKGTTPQFFNYDVDQLERSQELIINFSDPIGLSDAIANWFQAQNQLVEFRDACKKSYPNTGRWLIDNTSYTTWYEKANSFLWLYGSSGCGKTVICATAICSAFQSRRSAPEIGIAFYFFRNNRYSASIMLRSLIMQLSSQTSDEYKHLKQLHALYADSTPPILDLIATLQSLIQDFSHVHIFIDALDECPQGPARDQLLACLEKLHRASISGLHVLVTSRELKDIRECVQSLGSGISMENEAVDKDIADFISGHLQQSRKFKKWTAYHELIRDTLTSRANGIFRWVECQFVLLASCRCSKTRLDLALTSLPRSLDETYDRMLSSIPDENVTDAKRILTLLCFARKSLRFDEISDAIAVELDVVPKFNSGSRYQHHEDLFAICPGLIDGDYVPRDDFLQDHIMDSTIRIAHFSVQEYLESSRILEHTSRFFSMQCHESHNEIALLLLVYLLDPALSVDQVDNSIFIERPLIEYAAQNWYYHYSRADGNLERIEGLALQLLHDKSNNLKNWMRIRSGTVKPLGCESENPRDSRIETPNGQSIYFVSEKGLSSLLLVLLAIEQAESMSDSAKAENHISSIVNAQTDAKEKYALTAASLAGHDKIVQILLENGADINIQGGIHVNALQAACCKGHESIVQVLLDNGADINIQGGYHGHALQAASFTGRDKIVQILQENGADINIQGGYHGNALQAACCKGHESIVQVLLDNGADVNVQGGHFGNALQAASRRDIGESHHSNHEKIVQTLLDNGAEVNAQGGHYGNALQAASNTGLEKIVQLLLDNGADVNTQKEGPYLDALQAAISVCNVKIAEILLDNGADVNAQGGHCGNALQSASLSDADGLEYSDHEKLVQILLDNSADINAQGGYYGNALQAASDRGNEKIVQLLLENGADVNAQGGKYDNALQAACISGHEKVVEILLDKGANINAQVGGEYNSALGAASSKGHEKIIQILLNNGAEINAQEGPSNSALQAACLSGHERVVEILLENGAEVNAQGGGSHYNALQAASSKGHEKIVQILLKNGAEVNAQGGRYGSALYAACSWSHKGVIEILLEKGANVNIRGGYYGTALQVACFYNNAEIVEFLIEKGADINTREGLYGNALQLACHFHHTLIPQILLDKGADINIQGGFFGNALQSASSGIGDDRELVQMLIDKGADINAQGGHLGNALYAACYTGHEEVVQVLLDNGANVNAEGGECGTALKVATFEGHEKILQILLDSGADIEAGGLDGNALYAAVLGGQEKIVRRLLDHGAEINPKLAGGSLLVLAIAENHLETAQLLIERGIDVNAGSIYYNPLQIASGLGLYEMVQQLVELGADVHAKGRQGNALDFVALAQENNSQSEPSSENAEPTASTDFPVQFKKVLQILLDAGAGKNGEAQRVAAMEIPEAMKQLLLNYHE